MNPKIKQLDEAILRMKAMTAEMERDRLKLMIAEVEKDAIRNTRDTAE